MVELPEKKDAYKKISVIGIDGTNPLFKYLAMIE